MKNFYKGGRGMACGHSDETCQDPPKQKKLQCLKRAAYGIMILKPATKGHFALVMPGRHLFKILMSLQPIAYGILLIFVSMFSLSDAWASRPADPVGSDGTERQDTIRPLQIGDTIPAELWNMPLQVVNHPAEKNIMTLGDYRGSTILLDFFSTGCKACIEALPHLEEIVRRYGKDVILLPISNEKSERIASFIVKNHRLQGTKLPYIVEDATWRSIFNHRYISHVVWIDAGGIVRAFTNTNHVRDFTLEDFQENKFAGWPVKREDTDFFHEPLVFSRHRADIMPNNRSRTFHYAAFSDYTEGVGPYYATSLDTLEGVERMSFRNISLLDFGLIATGIGLFKRGDIFKEDISHWRVEDIGRYAYEFYDGPRLTQDQWYQKYAICYERTFPLGTSLSEKQELFRQDLKNLLGISVVRQGNLLTFSEDKQP